MTVWLSDIPDLRTSDFSLPVKPFTRYTCSVASMNTYGVGQPGSRISVQTPETGNYHIKISNISICQYISVRQNDMSKFVQELKLIYQWCYYIAAPSQPPRQLYTTNIGTKSVSLHWTYDETPEPGILVGFAIDVYEQDSRYPERNGDLVTQEPNYIVNQDEINFSYRLMYLSPGVRYNILISALTNAGEGPMGRVSFTTTRTGEHCLLVIVSLSLK